MSKSNTSKGKEFTGLMEFYDDFVEFNDYCAFFCDAMSALCSEFMDCEPDTYTLFGAKRHCTKLKKRAGELKAELNKIYKKSYTKANITKLTPNT